MAKYTFKFTTSFESTAVVDVELSKQAIEKLRAEKADTAKFSKLPVKNQVFTNLVLEAADRSLEEGVAELLRYNLRTELNATLRNDFTMTAEGDGCSLKHSPVKMVVDGLAVPAVPTNVVA
ncbi:hypothetical protein [Aeromonas phage JELG-KS1]|uniref:Uncharacterized protein n=1 Tax=Aeromonas phage JELG-KS1 TaxID=2951233 RepID=A0A9E7T0U7_9CAUD|nr:hypothetical protein [Aeromonas phage JELG-KS1]